MGNCCSPSVSISLCTGSTVSRCWNCAVRHANYTCKLQQNLKALSVELDKLKVRRDDVNRRVVFAEQQLNLRCLDEVQLWLKRAGNMIVEVDELIQKGPQEIQKLCLAGCFSTNCKSSYKFGREVARTLEEIVPLKHEGVFQHVSDQNEPEATVDVRPAEPTVGLESTLIKVCNLLEQIEVGMIGLYGLGGVGKTTLLTQINNKLSSLSSSPYDAIIWVVVSKDQTTENVQTKIGEKLHLQMDSWKHKSSDEKSQDIYRVLSRKKFVLFLDDIWEHVDLIKVGIPLPSQENGSKVVFTTRLFDVCGQMGANEKIQVRCLGEDEAWALFQQKVGEDTLSSHQDIRELAKMVVAECRGLPLALIVIGRAMTGKRSPKSWEFAIEVLMNSAHTFKGTAIELYPVLKFSYDNLPSDTIRSCLLYCCLFPEDYSISKGRLIDYWFCEGLLDAFECINKARLQGHDIIDTLINASLLEEAKGVFGDEDSVKMHDVIRDMALWISCDCEEAEKRFFVKARLQLTEAPEAGKWESARRVSFMQNQIECLTSKPTCPNLQTLFLGENGLMTRIENGFFQFMPNLRVLNLSYCGDFEELPKGISYLVSLECLDLFGTFIPELPIELKSLTNLKLLDLRVVCNLRIPQQLISSLSKLQVFRISHAQTQSNTYECKVLIGGEDDEGIIEELGSLQHLNEIEIEMEGYIALERLMRFHNLHVCIEVLGLWNFSKSEEFNVSCLAKMKSLRRLNLSNCESVEEMKIERGLCFHSLRSVTIEDCGKLRDMTWLILAPNLEYLVVKYCAEMEEIISEEKLGEVGNLPIQQPFSKLQSLFLDGLPELKSIYPKALPFVFLTYIEVTYCWKLEKLPLNSDSAKGNNLQIEGQREWWIQLEWEDEDTGNAFLPCFQPMN